MKSNNTDDLINDLIQDSCSVNIMPCPYWRFTLWFFVAIVYVGSIAMIFDLRPDILTKIHQELFLIELSVATLMTASALLACAFLCVPDSYNKQWIVYLPISLFVILSTIIFVTLYSQVTNPDYKFLSTAKNNTFQCALEIFLFSVPPAIASIYLIRQGATTKTYMSALCVALCSTGASYIALRLVEQVDDAQHIIIWHYVPIFLFSGITLLLSKRFFAW